MTGDIRVRRTPAGPSLTESTISEYIQEGRDNFRFLSEKYQKNEAGKKVIGFTEWLVMLVLVGVIYALVIIQDQRVPAVVPATEFTKFSEERARGLLNNLTDLGPRVSGSHALEVDAFNIIMNRLREIKSVVDVVGENRFEIDVHRPTGCYDLKFLSSFTLCYHKITNIAARIGPGDQPTKHAILLNCHFDTLPDTPGGTDDAVSCAILMEMLEVLARKPGRLANDVIVLFNGAEENFLQGSHGFITSHPWRHQVRAFINLEGSGAGGREILFQAGPGDAWLLKAYLDYAPHPHCSVLAQEIFQSGIIPSDTDFRIFRDYGRVSGLDIAYHRNGWLYHTEFDRAEFINAGAMQRAGENILAVVQGLITSPYLQQPAHFDEGNKFVFYDVVGLFTVSYKISTGTAINLLVVLAAVVYVYFSLTNGLYTLSDLLSAFGDHIRVFVTEFVVGVILVTVISALNLTMSWFAMPEIAFPLYILPMLMAGIWTHADIAQKKYHGIRTERFHYDSVLVIYAFILLVLTLVGLASSFFFLLHVFFPILRELIIVVFKHATGAQFRSPRIILIAQFLSLAPLIMFHCYAVMMFFDFFVPLTGRLGNLLNPDIVIMVLSFLTANTFVIFTSNLVYISRNVKYMVRCGVTVFAIFFILLLTTHIGTPYKFSETHPRLRRLIVLHSQRSIYNFDGSLASTENGLFLQAFDYRGISDLPDHTFMQTNQRPNCTGQVDEYCRLPYYTAIHELFPPEESLWVPLPAPPGGLSPVKVSLLRRDVTTDPATGLLRANMSFSLTGGADKLSLHVTPLNKGKLKNWSFGNFEGDIFGFRDTYFVFLTYGFEKPEVREFWIDIQLAPEVKSVAQSDELLELSAATHYAHGAQQNSPTLVQIRKLIAERRKSPHHAIGQWKWAITVIGGSSEIVVHRF